MRNMMQKMSEWVFERYANKPLPINIVNKDPILPHAVGCLGRQAAIRERIVLEEILQIIDDERDNEHKTFALRDLINNINLDGPHISVALSDLRTMGLIEIHPAYEGTEIPLYRITSALRKHLINPYTNEFRYRISTAWIPGNGFRQQRDPQQRNKVQWNNNYKHYTMT